MSRDEQEPRRSILARRARFVAAALATSGVASCGGKAIIDPAPVDAGAQGGSDAGGGGSGGAPQPCLGMALGGGGAGGEPQPCLAPGAH